MGRQGWVKQFTEAAVPGTFLRVIRPGDIRAGDPIEIMSRPDHEVTIAMVFRAVTLEPELLPRLLAAEALPEEIADQARRRISA
jgi:MOSC domain-containing protein YiiM